MKSKILFTTLIGLLLFCLFCVSVPVSPDSLNCQFQINLPGAGMTKPKYFIRNPFLAQVYQLHGCFEQSNYYAELIRISKEDQPLLKPFRLSQWQEMFSQDFIINENCQVHVTAYDTGDLIDFVVGDVEEYPENCYEPMLFVTFSNDDGYYSLLLHRRTRNLYEDSDKRLNETDQSGIEWIIQTAFLTPSPYCS